MNYDHIFEIVFFTLIIFIPTVILFIAISSFVDSIYEIIKSKFKIESKFKMKSNIVINFIFQFSLFIIIFVIIFNLLSKPTIINKSIFDCSIQNINCDNTCIIVKNDKDEYTFKNIPTKEIIFKKGNKNKLEVITCESFVNGSKLFDKKYESCKEKGYHEGENYILYLKDNIPFFNKGI